MSMGAYLRRVSVLAMFAVMWGQPLVAEEEEEVTASKISLRDYFPTAYGSVSLRQYHEMVAEGENPSPTLQLRGTLGAKFLDNKLNTSLTMAINKKWEDTEFANAKRGTVYERNPRLFAQYTLLTNDFVSISPYTQLIMPVYGGSLSYLELGSSFSSGHEMEIADVGDVTIGGTGYLWATQSIGKYKSKVEVPDGGQEKIREAFSLTPTEAGDLEIREDYARFNAAYALYASFAPEMIEDLALTVSTEYVHSMTPIWKGSDETIRHSGYKNSGGVENALTISYGLTEDVKISNTIVYNLIGFYEKVADSPRYVNLAMISYTPF